MANEPIVPPEDLSIELLAKIAGNNGFTGVYSPESLTVKLRLEIAMHVLLWGKGETVEFHLSLNRRESASIAIERLHRVLIEAQNELPFWRLRQRFDDDLDGLEMSYLLSVGNGLTRREVGAVFSSLRSGLKYFLASTRSDLLDNYAFTFYSDL